MLNGPSPEKLAKILPPLYATEDVPVAEKDILAHFFVGNFDWYICEYDPKNDLGWGYANLGDDHNAEWGMISIGELRDIVIQGWCHVDYDEYWHPTKAADIAKIIIR